MHFNLESSGDETLPPCKPGLAGEIGRDKIPPVGNPTGEDKVLGDIEKLLAIIGIESEDNLFAHLDSKMIERIVGYKYIDLGTLFKGKFKPQTKTDKQAFKLVKRDNEQLVYEPCTGEVDAKEIKDFPTKGIRTPSVFRDDLRGCTVLR